MNTWKRYGRLYRVQIAQFFKTIVQSKVDFLLGLFGFFFSEITGILFVLMLGDKYEYSNFWHKKIF